LKKKIIKFTTPWGHSFFEDRISKLSPSDYSFEIDNNCDYCDYWIVWGDLDQSQKNTVSASKSIFITDEVHSLKNYNQKFISQFDAVFTARDDIKHANIVKTHELNTWHLGKTFDELLALDYVPKQKKISVVCSDLTDMSGHKLRYALVNKLIGHFKDRLDVYGRGFNFIKDKYEALAPYKYSIAIENNAYPGYFTEKITECYLSLTMPIYYGCPDISNFFDQNSLLSIDINDYKKTIIKIEQLLEEDPYPQKLPLLIEQKNNYLNNYNIFSALPKILDKEFGCKEASTYRRIRLKPQHFFSRSYLGFIKSKLNGILKK